MMKRLIPFLLFSSLCFAEGKSCLPGEWHLVGSVEGHFSLGTLSEKKMLTVELWEKPEDNVSQALKENHAALVWGDCQALLLGFRASGKEKFPYASSSIKKIALNTEQDLIQIVSSYSHGFTEDTTQLYYIDVKKDQKSGELTQVWKNLTYEVTLRGEEKKYSISFEDLNHDGYADLRLKTPDGKTKTWFWNQKMKVFEQPLL